MGTNVASVDLSQRTIRADSGVRRDVGTVEASAVVVVLWRGHRTMLVGVTPVAASHAIGESQPTRTVGRPLSVLHQVVAPLPKLSSDLQGVKGLDPLYEVVHVTRPISEAVVPWAKVGIRTPTPADVGDDKGQARYPASVTASGNKSMDDEV